MRNLLEMIYDYQLLRSKERNLDIHLDSSERVRMMGLQRLLEGEVRDPRSREFVRVPMPLAAQFTRPGGFEAGEVKDLSGGGLLIHTRRPPAVGTQIIVRLEDESRGTEFVFPCTVVWRIGRGLRRMGVKIDGVPSKSDLFEESTGVWRRSVRFGAAPDEPMVA